MPGGDDLLGARVVNQMPVGISGVSHQVVFEGGVGYLAAMVSWDVDVCWAAKDAKVAQVWCAATRERKWDTIDAPVVCPVVEITCGHGGKFPVGCG